MARLPQLPSRDPVAVETKEQRRQIAELTKRQRQVVDASQVRLGTVASSVAYTPNLAITGTHVVATLVVADPGYPYLIRAHGFGVCRSPDGSSGRTDMVIRLGDASGPDICPQADGPSGLSVFSQVEVVQTTYPEGGSLEGTITLVAVALRVSGTGNGQVNSGRLYVETEPADRSQEYV